MVAMTWNSSADIGRTRSRSDFDGAITRRPITSPLGAAYWRMLSWVSSSSSSTRTPVSRSVSTIAHAQNAESSSAVTPISSPVSTSTTPTRLKPRAACVRS
jgi:hypothetical protein